MTDLKPRLTAAMVVKKNNKFLLARRNKENMFGRWVIPGGGVDFGETTKDAALREIKEETNLEVSNVSFLCVKEVINVPGLYHSVVFFYLGDASSDSLKACDDVSEAKFFSVEEMKELDVLQSVKDVFAEMGLW